MATPKKGDTTKATKAPAASTRVETRTGATRNTTATKAEGTTRTSPSSTADKKAAPVKLTENQARFLQSIHAVGEAGYEPRNKNEQRSIDAMIARKLLKRGTKNKETGNYRYLLTKAGTTHLPAAPTA